MGGPRRPRRRVAGGRRRGGGQLARARSVVPRGASSWCASPPSDTIGHPDDLWTARLARRRLAPVARLAEAETVLTRCLRLRPEDPEARAGLGKLALFHDHVDLAESLLAGASKSDPEAMNDLLAARVRAGDYAGAAALAPDVGQEGRVPLLERLAERAPYQIMGQRKDVSLPWASTYPVPLVKVKLNGQGVVMALDTGASDLILDESMARRCNVTQLKSRRLEFWAAPASRSATRWCRSSRSAGSRSSRCRRERCRCASGRSTSIPGRDRRRHHRPQPDAALHDHARLQGLPASSCARRTPRRSPGSR